MGVIINSDAIISISNELSYRDEGKLIELAMHCRNEQRCIGSIERCAGILGCSIKTCNLYIKRMIDFENGPGFRLLRLVFEAKNNACNILSSKTGRKHFYCKVNDLL